MKNTISCKIIYIISLTALVLLVLITSIKTVAGQADSSGVAISLPIKSEGVESGHIICGTKEGFVLCRNPYDPQMHGVIDDNPAAALEAPGTEGDVTRLVLQSGTATVWVSFFWLFYHITRRP